MIDEDSDEVCIVGEVTRDPETLPSVDPSRAPAASTATAEGPGTTEPCKSRANIDSDHKNGIDKSEDSDDDVIMVPVPRVLVLKKDEKTRGFVLGSVEINTPAKINSKEPKVVLASHSSTLSTKLSPPLKNQNASKDDPIKNPPNSSLSSNNFTTKASPLSSLNSNPSLVKKTSNPLPSDTTRAITSSSSKRLTISHSKSIQSINSLTSNKSPLVAKALLAKHKSQAIKREIIRKKFAASHPNNFKTKGSLKQQVAASFGNRIPIPGGGSASIKSNDKLELHTVSGSSTRCASNLSTKPSTSGKDKILLKEDSSHKRVIPKTQGMTHMTDLVQSIISASNRTNDKSNSELVKSKENGQLVKSDTLHTVNNGRTSKRVVVNESNGPQGKKVKMCDTDYNIDRVIAEKRAKHEQNISTSPSKPLGPAPKTVKRNAAPNKVNPTSSTLQNQISKLPKDVNSNKFTADPLLAQILEWKVTWMKESRKVKAKPPPVSGKPLKPLKLSYTSLKDYCETYEPLILHEIWGHVMQAFEGKQSGINVFVAISSYEAADPFLRIDCQTTVSLKEYEEQKHLSEGEMVLMELRVEGADSRLVFGYVQDLTTEDITKTTLMARLLKPPPNHKFLLKYHIRTRLRILKLDISQMMRVTGFYYLRPMLRNIEALYSLANSKLCEEILNPGEMACQMAFPQNIKPPDNSYNESQYKAILASVEAVQRPFPIPKMLLVQGPPGTGKTFTLIGMIRKMFLDWDDPSNSLKILVCTPSNGAVDEIARRLHDERHFLNQSSMKRSLRIVRLGQLSQIHPDIKKLSLDELVERNLKCRKTDLEKIHLTKINHLKDLAAKKDREIAELRAKNEKDKADKCAAEMYQVYRDLKLAQAEMNKAEESNSSQDKRMLKLDILRKADVILSTLNSCRHSLLEVLFQTERDPIRFNCAIIDEASQCAEPEILMPLMYNSISKLILIGDPMQLPATVISPHAAEYNYGRSLFERVFLHFGSYAPNSPVLMLDTQYRMHSEICSFPSLKFYDNRLKTPQVLDERPYPTKPYMVFDLRGTVENTSNPKNIINEWEADFVATLYAAVREMVPKNSTIGIVTPYQGQKKMLRDKLDNVSDNFLDINTIDGFQGQERDVIILSLVRDFSKKDSSIGFLTSTHRLNVALTRARHSLMLCLSDASQITNELWKSLIEDAESRQAIYRTSYKSRKGFQKLISRSTSPDIL